MPIPVNSFQLLPFCGHKDIATVCEVEVKGIKQDYVRADCSSKGPSIDCGGTWPQRDWGVPAT